MTPWAQEPRLRADARRNRDAVLAAAGEVFAEEGLDAPLCEIARRAGVGQGTLYRRFPSREALIEAIADDHLAELGRMAARAGAGPAAFLTFFGAAVRLRNDDGGLIDLLMASSSVAQPLPGSEERRSAFLAMLAPLLRRAQEAGLVRRDLAPEDVRLLLKMLGAVSRRGEPAAGRDRALALVLDAMRVTFDDGMGG